MRIQVPNRHGLRGACGGCPAGRLSRKPPQLAARLHFCPGRPLRLQPRGNHAGAGGEKPPLTALAGGSGAQVEQQDHLVSGDLELGQPPSLVDSGRGHCWGLSSTLVDGPPGNSEGPPVFALQRRLSSLPEASVPHTMHCRLSRKGPSGEGKVLGSVTVDRQDSQGSAGTVREADPEEEAGTRQASRQPCRTDPAPETGALLRRVA